MLVIFGRVLFDDHQFAFRDAGNFYYPLIERVQQEWDAGRWPLWAPEASAGMPLLGNPTAAVLYPGKLIFFAMPYPGALRAYLVGHVALAFVAMVALLRGWRVSAIGSMLGALAYAFGVPVLSQTSNMIFLVGAAWAPLGLLAADRWVRLGKPWAVAALALVLALQVLGGDPEAAYLTLVCAAGYGVGWAATRQPSEVSRWLWRAALALIVLYIALLGLSWWAARSVQALSAATSESAQVWAPPRGLLVSLAWGLIAAWMAWRARAGRDSKGLTWSLGGLVASAALALAISGAQLLPVLEYTGMSFRAAESEGFHDFYPYSVHPVQLLDTVWPNAFGSLEGGYRSWLNALPPKPENRLWMPSLYLGVLTLVLASAAFGFRDGPPWRVWLSAVALVSLLASLGYYGSPLLWARCVPGWEETLGPLEPAFSWKVRDDGHLRDGDGGVYWLLASALPGFRSFRYPSKLMVLWSLAVAALAALGWDRVVSGRSKRATIAATALLAAGLLAMAVTWLGSSFMRAGFEGLAERLQGSDEPLDVDQALADLHEAIRHGVLASAAALGVLLLARRWPLRAGTVALGVLILDLCLANAGNVVTVPQSVFEETPRALALIEEAEQADPSPGPFRVQRVGMWWPLSWSGPGATRDFEKTVPWERNTLRPHYGLPLGVESTFFFDTIEPLDYGLFFLPWSIAPDPETVRLHNLRPGQRVWYYPRRAFDLWNTRYFIVPARLVWESVPRGYAAFIPNSTFLYPPIGAFDGPDGPERRAHWESTEDFRILRNEAAFPRAWVVHRAYLNPPIRGLRAVDRSRVMQQLLYQGDEFWRSPGMVVRDPRQIAWVETNRPEAIDPLLSRADPDPSETVVVTRDEPQRVELTAALRSGGLVVVADLYYPGWKLTVNGQPAEILRTNRAMRGVVLPEGTHQLVFRYEPLSFRLGVVLSVLGLAAWAALVIRGVWGSRRQS